MTDTETARVWLGCLGCYNAGRLVGQWIDVDPDLDLAEWTAECHAAIWGVDDEGAAHNRCQVEDCRSEEWHMCDHEGFLGYTPGRYSGLDELHKAASTVSELEGEGHDRDAIGAALQLYLDLDSAATLLRDGYGCYESAEEWAQETYGELHPEAVALLGCYVDWERVAIALGTEATATEHAGKWWVFNG